MIDLTGLLLNYIRIFMKTFTPLVLTAIVITSCSQPTNNTATTAEAPIAKKVPFEITTNGDTRIDNYYWMRDMERKDPEILAH